MTTLAELRARWWQPRLGAAGDGLTDLADIAQAFAGRVKRCTRGGCVVWGAPARMRAVWSAQRSRRGGIARHAALGRRRLGCGRGEA